MEAHDINGILLIIQVCFLLKKKQQLPSEMSKRKRANQMRDSNIILIFHSISVLHLIRIYQTFKKIDFFLWLEKILMGSIRPVNELQTDGLKMIKAGNDLLCFYRVRVLPWCLLLWCIQPEGSFLKNFKIDLKAIHFFKQKMRNLSIVTRILVTI